MGKTRNPPVLSVLATFSFSFAGAVLLYVMILPFWASSLLFALGILGAVVGFFLPKGRAVRLVAVGLALGFLWTFVYELWYIRPLEAQTGEGILISLTALEDEEATDYGCKVLCKSGNVRVLTYLFERSRPVRAGDKILLEGVLETAAGEGDLTYLAKEIGMIARQKGEAVITTGEKTLGNLPARLYGELQRRILQLFPQDTAPFALALLTGDTGRLSYSFRNQMSLAGISHVVAVSGMHVSLICSLVLNLCLRRKRLAAGVCLVVMWFFGAMLGFSPSVTRAVVMNSVLLTAPVLKREYDSPTALGFSLLLLLVKNPFSIASVGLQLSFASVGGILLLTGPVSQFLIEHLPRRLRALTPVGRVCKFLTASVATTIGASLLTIPLSAYYFGTVSLISFVSNLVLLPLISLIFSLSYGLVVLSFWIYPLGTWAAEAISIPIRWILSGIQFLGEIPYGALYSRSPYVVLWLIGAYGLLILSRFVKEKRGLALVLCVSMLVSVPFLERIHGETLRFTMLNVGQGQCILAEVGDVAVVIDCGGAREEAVGEEAARELLCRGHLRVHSLILTHYDLDHTGGALHFMDRMEIGCVYLPDISHEDPQREKILQKAGERNIPVCWVKEDVCLPLEGGSLNIFAPVATKSENDGLSLLLSAEDYDILITGDLSTDSERELMLSRALPDLEILIAGHHGSAKSTGQKLLEYTMPEELWISVGENSYGHPDPRVLERARSLGIRVRRTDLEGTIIIKR